LVAVIGCRPEAGESEGAGAGAGAGDDTAPEPTLTPNSYVARSAGLIRCLGKVREALTDRHIGPGLGPGAVGDAGEGTTVSKGDSKRESSSGGGGGGGGAVGESDDSEAMRRAMALECEVPL
jgi:hypothetical protein